jgi:hypothetical protein
MATKNKIDNTTMILSSVGALAGLYYAFSNNKGFWGYAGYFILGSIAGGLAGNIIGGIATSKSEIIE